MSLIIAGTVRVPAENVVRFRAHMLEMVAATRAEDGCLAYSFAEDVGEPGLIHVFELWSGQGALDGHFASGHMARWRAAAPTFGVSERTLTAYEVAGQRPL